MEGPSTLICKNSAFHGALPVCAKSAASLWVFLASGGTLLVLLVALIICCCACRRYLTSIGFLFSRERCLCA